MDESFVSHSSVIAVNVTDLKMYNVTSLVVTVHVPTHIAYGW